eukprot:4306215-Karenia_brevis.AAC.1
MTKYLAQADLYKHFRNLSLNKENERPQAAAELSQIRVREEKGSKIGCAERTPARPISIEDFIQKGSKRGSQSEDQESKQRNPSTWRAFMVHAGGDAKTPWQWH